MKTMMYNTSDLNKSSIQSVITHVPPVIKVINGQDVTFNSYTDLINTNGSTDINLSHWEARTV